MAYPDKIYDAKDLRVRNMINGDSSSKAAGTPLCYLKPDEIKIVKDFIRREIAVRNAVYYPFIINLPLKLQDKEEIAVEGRKDIKGNNMIIKRQWFYYEVEIISRIGADVSLVLGLLPEPKDQIIDVTDTKDFVYPEEASKPGAATSMPAVGFFDRSRLMLQSGSRKAYAISSLEIEMWTQRKNTWKAGSRYCQEMCLTL